MRRFLALLLFAAVAVTIDGGGVPTSASPLQELREFASSHTDADCASFGLKYADRNGDGRLSREEFENLTLIAFDATVDSHRRQLADLEARAAKTHSAPNEGRRQEFLAALARWAKQRPAWAAKADARFARFDSDQDGTMDRTELEDACGRLAHGEEAP